MNYQFSPVEFKKMVFNPVKVPEKKSVFSVYPELKPYKILKQSPGHGIDNEKVMLYLFCMYDKNTPYRAKYPDILKRKVEVARDVGFDLMEGGIFKEPVEEMLRGENKVVNAKIVEFVRLHKNYKYSYLVSIENSYYNIMLDVINGNTKRISDLKDVQEELEDTILELLNDDDNPSMKKTLLRYMEMERLGLRPEDIALKIAQGKKPVRFEEII